MKKSKKLLKYKKPVVVLIYGAPSVGKYTTAKQLAKITGFKILHHHSIRDLIFGFFRGDTKRRMFWRDRENINGQKIWESFYFNFMQAAMREKASIVFTHTHARNRVYCTGISSTKFIKKIKKIVTKNKGIFFPVHLVCETEELLRRVLSPSRRCFKKCHTVKEMKWMLKNRDYSTSLSIENNFIINNTRISAKRTALIIKNHFNL